jgi:hypothetical protein
MLNPSIAILAAAALVCNPGASYTLSFIITLVGAISLGITYAITQNVHHAMAVADRYTVIRRAKRSGYVQQGRGLVR